MKKILFATAISLIFSVLLFAQNLPTIPLHLDLPAAPMPYKIDGKIHLLYELHITSYRRTPVILDKLEVFGEKGESSSLASYDGSTLTGMIGAPGTVEKADAKKLIKPGERAIVFIDITLDRNLPTPNVLRHRLHISRPGSKDAARWIEHKGFKVNTNTPPIISPPLRGTGWIAFNGVSNFSDHRRATIVLSGSAFLAQRFAIDWAKVNSEGKALKDSITKNENFYGYGEDLIAVADGVVVDTKDGIPNNDIASGKKAVRITIDTIGGNYVVLDIGNGYHAFYGHLIPGSLKVKIGDKVKTGQLLGKLGNSGNSDAPHLHFHLTEGNSPLGANGVPYLIKSFRVQGTVGNLDEILEGKSWIPVSKVVNRNRLFEIPSENSVIDFP